MADTTAPPTPTPASEHPPHPGCPSQADHSWMDNICCCAILFARDQRSTPPAEETDRG